MAIRLFKCGNCGHRLRLGVARCGYCGHPTPGKNRAWIIAIPVIAVCATVALKLRAMV